MTFNLLSVVLLLLLCTFNARANDNPNQEDDSLLEIEIIHGTNDSADSAPTTGALPAGALSRSGDVIESRSAFVPIGVATARTAPAAAPSTPAAVPAPKRCDNPAPGLNRLRRGVDVTRLDFLPLEVGADDGFRQPVVDYTCDQGKRVRIKTPAGGEKIYDLPDQIWDVAAVPGGLLTEEVDIFKSSHEVKKSMAAEAGIDIFGGIFSASGSYSKMSYSLTNQSKYIEDVRSFVSGSRVDMAPFWALKISHYANLFVQNRLPAKFEDAPDRYEEFIRYFGTHLFVNGKFGGLIHLFLETEKSYFLGKTERSVKANAGGMFRNILKAQGGYSGATVKVDESFKSSTTKTIRYHGGDTNLLSNEGLKKWQPTVAENPWIFAGSLAPLSELITDAAKKTSMERAVQVHADKARLRAASNLIYGKMNVYAQAADMRSLLTRAAALLRQASPDHASVDRLCGEIESQMTVPDWFKDVKLCYRWYPDGDGGQCGGGVGRLLCATPDAFTTYYRDDTDGRSGGCRMSWGLTAPNSAPVWFSNAQICYRWYPDGDGGQCGGGAGRNLCAKVGQYTAYYRDDTDRRGGGCRMSWSLKAPSSAPLWARNLDLCYQWYPDGDGGQCGGGAARNLCAKTNAWTGYYRDDTDRRGGGCRMRWGLKTN